MANKGIIYLLITIKIILLFDSGTVGRNVAILHAVLLPPDNILYCIVYCIILTMFFFLRRNFQLMF